MKSFIFLIWLFISLTGVASRIQVSCSVFLYGENDWLIENRTNNCVTYVQRVREFCGGDRINFVPTLFFVDNDNDDIPEYYSTKQGLVYYEINNTNTQNFKEGMAVCFKEAISQKFKVIELTPHLDDGTGKGKWRNTIIMNPLEKYSGKSSYYSAMIQPLLHAFFTATNNKKTSINLNFALQGEMNRMLMYHPKQWLKLARFVRCFLPTKKSKVGVSVNFNKLCGMKECSDVLNELDLLAISNLFYGVDFVGMSSYSSMTDFKDTSNFANGISVLTDEFRLLEIDLKNYSGKGIDIHFSEFGIGGASCAGNNFIAKTSKEALPCPWFGIHGKFDEMTNPWRTKLMNTFQADYYAQFIRWVATETDNLVYPVKEIYIWNVASWDVTGIYKDSSNENGTYQNKKVVDMLKSYNNENILP
jgi:hypothetical protein